jgi:hypothetical protein
VRYTVTSGMVNLASCVMSGNYGPPAKFPLPNNGAVVPFTLPNQYGGGGRGPVHVSSDAEPLDFLLAVMRSSEQPMDRRMDAAKAAAPYRHTRLAPAAITDETGGIKIQVSGGLPQEEEAVAR